MVLNTLCTQNIAIKITDWDRPLQAWQILILVVYNWFLSFKCETIKFHTFSMLWSAWGNTEKENICLLSLYVQITLVSKLVYFNFCLLRMQKKVNEKRRTQQRHLITSSELVWQYKQKCDLQMCFTSGV